MQDKYASYQIGRQFRVMKNPAGLDFSNGIIGEIVTIKDIRVIKGKRRVITEKYHFAYANIKTYLKPVNE